MSTEPKRIVLRMDSDPRLAAAAGGAVRFLAETAGLPEEDCREFQQATLEACLKEFQSHPLQSHSVEVLVFVDRLEVIVDAELGPASIRLSRSVVPQS